MTKDTITPIHEHQKIYFVWDGEQPEINLHVELSIPGTGIDIYGVLLGHSDKEVTVNISIEHIAKNTSSFVLLKGLLKDQAKVKFNGLVAIKKGAKQTNAWLSCYYLLLSQQAKGQAIPSLEIAENDVKAGHATTAGKLDWSQLFYVMSRGIPEAKARKLLIDGYIADVLQFMPKDIHREVHQAMQLYGY